jgi:hypothetical protein
MRSDEAIWFAYLRKFKNQTVSVVAIDNLLTTIRHGLQKLSNFGDFLVPIHKRKKVSYNY